MTYKLKRLKVLNRYSEEQSKEYDLKIYAEFVHVFWWFKKPIKFTIYRSNSVCKLSNKRRYSSGYPLGCSYYLEDGNYLPRDFCSEIEEHFKRMHRIREERSRQLLRVQNIKDIK